MNTLKRGNKWSIANRACLVLTLFISLGLWSSATAKSFPETIPLQPGSQPEGITMGTGHTAYVGSLAGGGIYEVDLRTGARSELVPGVPDVPGMPGTPGQLAVGLDFDERSGYLFVAGGFYGDGRIYDTETGDLVAQIPLFPFDPFNPFAGWINDVVVTREAAYFTNSFVAEIWKVPLTARGVPYGIPQRLPLGGDDDWMQVPGPMVINANGIVGTPDGGTLIVINYAMGLLYKVNPDTGYATAIDLGGITFPTGDGLVLRGKTLYVVQNAADAIAVLNLSPDFTTATFTEYLFDGDLRVPSTADLFGPWLYTVNARFDVCFPGNPCPDDTEFEIVRVRQ